MRTAGSNRLRGELAGNELRTRKEYVSDHDGGFKQPLERCKLLTRWASEYFDQTGTELQIGLDLSWLELEPPHFVERENIVRSFGGGKSFESVMRIGPPEVLMIVSISF